MPIPVVDISNWEGGTEQQRATVAEQWNYAFCKYGFAVVVGHGIEEEVFNKLNEECKSFFTQPLTSKMKYNHGIYGHPDGGYTPPGSETVALSSTLDDEAHFDNAQAYKLQANAKAKSDPVENFVFTSPPCQFNPPNSAPSGTPIASANEYYKQMDALLKSFHSITCAAVGIEDLTYLDKFYDSSIPGNETMGMNGNALRLAYYPALQTHTGSSTDTSTTAGPPKTGQNPQFNSSTAATTTASAEEEKLLSELCDSEIRYGAHTDYQGYTILRPDKTDWHKLTVATDSFSSPSVSTEPCTTSSTIIHCGGLEVLIDVDPIEDSATQTGNTTAVPNDTVHVVQSNHATALGTTKVTRKQQWVPVRIPVEYNALVVNAGDLIERWTNGKFRSAVHRVVSSGASPTGTSSADSSTAANSSDGFSINNNSVRNTKTAINAEPSAQSIAAVQTVPIRQSIVFFTGPLENCMIEVLNPAKINQEYRLLCTDRNTTSDVSAHSYNINNKQGTTIQSPQGQAGKNRYNVLVESDDGVEIGCDGSAIRYSPIRSGDHLLMKLNRTNHSV